MLDFIFMNVTWTILSLFCLLTYVTNYLDTYWLSLFFIVLIIWFLSMWMTIVVVHRIKPRFKYYKSLENLTNSYLQSPLIYDKDYNCVDSLVSDVDQYCISNWYSKVSKDTHFTNDSREIIKDVFAKFLKAQSLSHTKVILYGTLNVYFRHLKEYKKSIEKHKCTGCPVTTVYRYVHPCSQCPEKRNYFIYQVTVNFMSKFVNWELRNSLPCHIVDAIVARKLLNQILNLGISPKCLNYYLLKLMGFPPDLLGSSMFVCLTDEQFKEVEYIENKKDEKSNNSSPTLSQQNTIEDEKSEPKSEPKEEKVKKPEVSSSPLEEEEKVKPIASIEKDILPSIEESVANTRPFPISTKKIEVKPIPEKVEIPLGNNREKLLSGMSDIGTKKLLHDVKSSIKPLSGATMNTIQSIKGEIKGLHHHTLDSVVKPVTHVTSTALLKIGDFQDEAVDVVEGIIDFGKAGISAGIRRGLMQFSGLQDQTSPKPELVRQSAEISPGINTKENEVSSTTTSLDTSDDTWAKSLEEIAHIKKTADISDEADESKKDVIHPKFLPVISMNLLEPNTDSPDPEYEETADLATTIAKLRSLLQQKSSESSMSTPSVSPMPPEDFAHSDTFYNDNAVFPSDDNGKMPSFYKFCAKTATGVLTNTLNTIKTALPGNTIDGEYLNTNCWNFIEAENSDDLLVQMNKLLLERKAFCTVDNAYEAIESLKEPDESVTSSALSIEDDLDDPDFKTPVSKMVADILSELLLETDSIWIQEPVIKVCLLIFGQSMENRLIETFNFYAHRLIANYKYSPHKTPDDVFNVTLDEMVQMILSHLPGMAVYLIGRNAVEKAVRLFLSSLQFQRINDDMFLQICELACLSFEEIVE